MHSTMLLNACRPGVLEYVQVPYSFVDLRRELRLGVRMVLCASQSCRHEVNLWS